MLLTDRFVFIHQPKTGGTFVTEVLERVFAGRCSVRGGPALVNVDKHGTCDTIPASHRGLPVLAVFRHPWSRYVSQYNFAWWKKKLPPWIERESFLAEYPDYPELSFPGYVTMVNRRFVPPAEEALREGEPPGFNSYQFVRFFFREAATAWNRLGGASPDPEALRAAMYPVRFLDQDRLNRDLHAALRDLGFPEEEIAFVAEHGKVLPKAPRRASRPPSPWWEMWTPGVEALVRRRERLLWSLFPEAEDALDRARRRAG